MAKLKIVRNVKIGGQDAKMIGSYAGVDYYTTHDLDDVQYIHGFVGDNHVFRIACEGTIDNLDFKFQLENEDIKNDC